MGRQGVKTPQPIINFMVDDARAHPEFTDQQIADRVLEKFRQEIDRSVAGKYRRKAGLSRKQRVKPGERGTTQTLAPEKQELAFSVGEGPSEVTGAIGTAHDRRLAELALKWRVLVHQLTPRAFVEEALGSSSLSANLLRIAQIIALTRDGFLGPGQADSLAKGLQTEEGTNRLAHHVLSNFRGRENHLGLPAFSQHSAERSTFDLPTKMLAETLKDPEDLSFVEYHLRDDPVWELHRGFVLQVLGAANCLGAIAQALGRLACTLLAGPAQTLEEWSQRSIRDRSFRERQAPALEPIMRLMVTELIALATDQDSPVLHEPALPFLVSELVSVTIQEVTPTQSWDFLRLALQLQRPDWIDQLQLSYPALDRQITEYEIEDVVRAHWQAVCQKLAEGIGQRVEVWCLLDNCVEWSRTKEKLERRLESLANSNRL